MVKEQMIVVRYSKHDTDSAEMANGYSEEEVYVMPASYNQQRFWYVGNLYGQTRGVNVINAYRIWGNLHLDTLEQSFNEVMRRHEILRTSLELMDGNLVQVISPEMRIPIAQVDLSDLSAEEQSARVQGVITEESKRPFDLQTPPLIRVVFVRLAAQEHILMFNIHHSVTDDWSMDLLVKELNILYGAFSTGQPSPLAELPIQYADYALWERETWQAEVLESNLSYWRERLEGMKEVLSIPADRPRPPTPTFEGSSQCFELPASLSHELRELSKRERVTPYMTLLAAFSLLLQRYTGETDLPIGSQYINRNHPRVNNLIGCFENPFVLRQDLSGDPTILELLSRVREVNTSAYAHAELPFVKLVDDLNPKRDPSYNPLFQVDFFTLSERTPLQLGDCKVAQIQIESAPWVDLSITVLDSGEYIHGNIIYSTDLFDGDTIKRMFDHYRILLEGIVADPKRRISELPLLTKMERQRLLVELNDTESELPQDKCIHELLQDQVERTPDNVAIVYEAQQLSYLELNRRVNQLAHYLRSLGVGPEVLVGIFMERSQEMVVGLLAILKAGGAYVPLDPEYPKERIAFMLEDSQVSTLLTQKPLLADLPNHCARVICIDTDWDTIALEDDDNPACTVTAENLAYLIYTSGSTGRPKGVQIPHRALFNCLTSMARQPGLTDQDTLLAVTTLSFDIAALELFLPITVGARLEIASREVASDGVRLADALESSSATVMQATPATWQLLVEAGWQGCDYLKIMCGGESLPKELAAKLLGRCSSLWNLYGPTETTIWSTVHEVGPSDGSIPIGTPIANTQVYLLDPRLQPVPVGVPGELYIGGFGLARGYLNRPELTSEKFIIDPFSNEPESRLYKTGDLARRLSGGNIEFLGRNDYQVKIRGYRIELGEIEAVLEQHPAIRQAVVVAQGESLGDKRLTAYLAQSPEHQDSPLAERWHYDQTTEWQSVWEDKYSQAPENPDPTLNIVGWNSSYSGLPIPQEEMKEWVDHTVDRILSLHPNRILEIGCGTGLLLLRIAPHCSTYWGTDFSTNALDYIHHQLAKPGRQLPQVQLTVKRADDFAGLEAQTFDTVIINSVVQYFPSIDYLLQVIEGAVRIAAPGGNIFIGDVRSLPLLEAFHSAVELYHAPEELRKDQLQQRMRKSLREEGELVIDPAFFQALGQRMPQISGVEIQLKRGKYHNELTRFRYDVTLQLGAEVVSQSNHEWVDWEEEELTVAGLRQLLEETEPEAILIKGVPNARLEAEVYTVALLNGGEGAETAGELKEAVKELPIKGVDPEELWRIGADLPYKVQLTWLGTRQDGSYDVVLNRTEGESEYRDRAGAGTLTGVAAKPKPWREYGNNPMRASNERRLVPELRNFLAEKLPKYMVPSAFVVLDELPLTPNGKVDRQALPAPNFSRPNLNPTFQSPSTPVECAIAEIWKDLLRMEKVGKYDNFFELGGHSLLSMRAIAKLEKSTGIRINPMEFMFQTLSQVASVIEGKMETSQQINSMNLFEKLLSVVASRIKRNGAGRPRSDGSGAFQTVSVRQEHV